MNQTHSVAAPNDRSLNTARWRGLRWWLVLAALAAAGTMPGCVVQRISDNLELANAQMQSINESIVRVEAQIEELQTVRLGALYERLDRLESLDRTLNSVDSDLDTVSVSLQRLDEHLASLRRTVQNIGSTIPFLKIADDEEEVEGEESGEPEAPSGSEPAPGSETRPETEGNQGTQPAPAAPQAP